jgi:hypothetical protein
VGYKITGAADPFGLLGTDKLSKILIAVRGNAPFLQLPIPINIYRPPSIEMRSKSA